MIRYLLGKPFEWLMRLFFKIHLAIDGNSEWYMLDQGELNVIVNECIEDNLYTIGKYDFDDDDFVCECD